MKNVALFFLVQVFAYNSFSDALKLDAELLKRIDLCAEQDKNAAKSDFVKFLEDKKSQTLEKYLKFDAHPELCDLKYSIRAVTAVRKFESEYEKSLEKLDPKVKAEKMKARIEFIMKPLGRDYLNAASVLMNLIILRSYEMSLQKVKLAEVDTWLKQFQKDIVGKKESIYEKLIDQDYRVMQWLVLNEPKLFEGKKPTTDEKIQLVQKLEAERKVLSDNKVCLLSEKCFYCVKEVSPKACDHDVIAKKAEEFGEAGQIVVPKIWEAIVNLNKRMAKYGKFD